MTVFAELAVTIFFSFAISLAAFILTPRIFSRIPQLSPRTLDRIFLLLVALYVIVFSALYVLRYLSINSGTDLGVYDQLVWNTLNGRLFETTLLADVNFYFGKSFSPLIAAFVPFYAILRDPAILILVQTFAIAFAAFPIFWFARERLGRPLALVIAAAFLLSPAVENANHTDVHIIAFAMPTLALATYFLLRRHYTGLLVSLGIGLLIREEIGFIVIAFGVYIFLFQRRRWFGLGLALFGSAWTAFLVSYLIPYFQGSSTFYYFGGGQSEFAQMRYTYLGHSLKEVLLTIVTRPDLVLREVFIPDKVAFMLQLIAPLGLIPLVAPEIAMLMLPTLGYSLLSNFSFQYSIQSFYPAPLLPFLFFATIGGAQRLIQFRQPKMALGANSVSIRSVAARKWALGILILISTGISYYLYAPGPFARAFDPHQYAFDSHAAIGRELMASIPPQATVVAQNELVAQLSARRFIYDFPSFPEDLQIDYFIADKNRLWFDLHKPNWDELLESGSFESVFQQDGFMIIRRR